jgi:alpha/beta superfamily hydrolase
LKLVGEIALPPGGAQVAATLVLIHPLPTEGGSMDSHLFRKAAWRLPALADLAVVRFNTRGTASALGQSEGRFDHGDAEAADLAAVVAWVHGQGLPKPWLVGWSFGSEVALMHGARLAVAGLVAVSPPLRRARSEHLVQWAAARKPVVAIVPEKDQFLKPAEARARLALLPTARVVEGADAGHLWIGEKAVRQALGAMVEAVRPGFGPLPTSWDGPSQIYRNGTKETL